MGVMALYRFACIIFDRQGGFFYLPHAARVLCVIYFGFKAIPGLYLGELVGPYVLDPGLYSFSTLLPSLISVMSVPFALTMLNSLGLTLGHTRSSPLNKKELQTHFFDYFYISWF